MNEVIMPQVGQDIPTAKILAWHKQVGDPVEEGELLLEVESDKATFEISAEETGILLEILYAEGDEVEILKPIAFIGEAGEIREANTAKDEPPSALPKEDAPVSREQAAATLSDVSGRVAASPAARRLARENGLDLKTLSGTGPDGRITRADVEELLRQGRVE